jgi:predicted nucleic acid-binding protein
MFVLDTNVVSELRKISSRWADARVAAWVRVEDWGGIP